MKTAVVVLATGEYWQGAKVLFYTLETLGKLPDSIDRVVLGMDIYDFARAVLITVDYSWVKVSQTNFPRVADKFFALTLDYDRIILLDADMLCVGDCRYLWSDDLGQLPFYACRDTASASYYADEIRDIGLNPDLLFHAGAMVFHRGVADDLLTHIADGSILSYDGGDQGYLNHYFQKISPGCLGWLPPEYNCCLDKNMPQLPDHAKRLVHFCGSNANPWNWQVELDWRLPYYERWQRAWEECSR